MCRSVPSLHLLPCTSFPAPCVSALAKSASVTGAHPSAGPRSGSMCPRKSWVTKCFSAPNRQSPGARQSILRQGFAPALGASVGSRSESLTAMPGIRAGRIEEPDGHGDNPAQNPRNPLSAPAQPVNEGPEFSQSRRLSGGLFADARRQDSRLPIYPPQRDRGAAHENAQ